MPISAKVNGTRTLWQKLWGGSLTWYLAKKAKEFGVEQAVIQRVSGGYLKGKKLVSNLGEIIPDDLPMCIEMIDGEEKLRSFVGHYKDQLSGCPFQVRATRRVGRMEKKEAEPDSMIEICEELHKIEAAVEDFSLLNLKPLLGAALELRHHRDILDVAVVGRFKAGKSSVLNSILNAQLLPTGVLPVTSVITRVIYGHQEMISVRFLNGTEKIVQAEEISAFASEKQNPDNIKQVEGIDIFTPKMASFRNLRFVDTPGLGSIFEHNTEVAKKWLPNIAAALVCIAPDPPMSKEELALIKEVEKLTPELYIVLTKADLVSDADRNEIHQFIERHTADVRKRSIIEYSIRPEFQELRASGLIRCLDDISSQAPLKNQIILKEKTKLLRELTISSLEISLASAQATEDVRQDLMEKLGAAAHNLSSLMDDMRIVERDFGVRARAKIADVLVQKSPELIDELNRVVSDFIAKSQGSITYLSGVFEITLEEEIRKRLASLSEKQFGAIIASFHDASRKVRERAEHWLTSLSSLAWEALNVELKNPPVEHEPRLIRRPDIQISISIDAPIAILGTIFPFLVSRKWIGRKFHKQVSFEVEKNLSRLTTQWHEISKEYLHNYIESIEAHLSTSLKTLKTRCRSTSRDEIESISRTLTALSISN